MDGMESIAQSNVASRHQIVGRGTAQDGEREATLEVLLQSVCRVTMCSLSLSESAVKPATVGRVEVESVPKLDPRAQRRFSWPAIPRHVTQPQVRNERNEHHQGSTLTTSNYRPPRDRLAITSAPALPSPPLDVMYFAVLHPIRLGRPARG
ncbi:hypothetical protein K402DRAFT_83646 [Aulographum hederae CBS 113979]|uniref:Uncharacterized protein n=1 Tax=Aulographum hederae CBS 113979 TaxID=1176131 RepID=A0A6G1H0A7_9PEZI|nr:hypothetical protein K402DRAFT_83646 [Aulographum hederae CBS 113979]